jgi:hypothetical protein
MTEATKTLCFDYSHNNKLIIESSSYSDFVQYLFGSGFRVGQIKQKITVEKLKQYHVFIIGNPYDSKFDLDEIEAIEKYVKEGGGLFLISDSGADIENLTNINEVSEKFGFIFNPDKLHDSVQYIKDQDKLVINKFEPHYITRDVENMVHSSGCSITTNESIEADEHISIHILAKSSLNTFADIYNGNDTTEEDKPYCTILSAVNYYKGRVVGLGNLSIFSSLSSYYGYTALNNSLLLSNIINWLASAGAEIEDTALETKVMSVPVNYSLFLWMEKLIKDNQWEKVGDIINFAIKYLKDNYTKVVEETKERREKLKEQREKQKAELTHKKDAEDQARQAVVDDVENTILDLADEEKRTGKEEETLDDIMKELSRMNEDQK